MPRIAVELPMYHTEVVKELEMEEDGCERKGTGRGDEGSKCSSYCGRSC